MTTNEITAMLEVLGHLAMIVCWTCILIFVFKARQEYKRKEKLRKQADEELNAIKDMPRTEFDKAMNEWHQKYKDI